MESNYTDAHIFMHLQLDQLPPIHEIPTHIVLTLLKMIVRVCLMSPINLVIFYAIFYLVISSIINFFRKPKTFVYYPEPHQQKVAPEIKNLSKEVREIQKSIFEKLCLIPFKESLISNDD